MAALSNQVTDRDGLLKKGGNVQQKKRSRDADRGYRTML